MFAGLKQAALVMDRYNVSTFRIWVLIALAIINVLQAGVAEGLFNSVAG